MVLGSVLVGLVNSTQPRHVRGKPKFRNRLDGKDLGTCVEGLGTCVGSSV